MVIKPRNRLMRLHKMLVFLVRYKEIIVVRRELLVYAVMHGTQEALEQLLMDQGFLAAMESLCELGS